jgi:hypothetical protein
MDLPDEFEFWVAHDHPERPLDHGVFVCDCDACLLAVQTAARLTPRFTLMIRTNFDRVAVAVDYLAEVWERDGCIEALTYFTDDWIRDVGSATNALPRPHRWWSLSLAEELASHRRAQRKHVPTRRWTAQDWANHMGII